MWKFQICLSDVSIVAKICWSPAKENAFKKASKSRSWLNRWKCFLHLGNFRRLSLASTDEYMLDCLGLFELVKFLQMNWRRSPADSQQCRFSKSQWWFFWMPRLFPGKLARLSWKMKTVYWGDMISLFCRIDLKADVGIGWVCLVMLPILGTVTIRIVTFWGSGFTQPKPSPCNSEESWVGGS